MSDEPRIRLEDSGTVVSEYWYDQSTGETVVESESGETYRFANDGTLDTPALNTDSANIKVLNDSVYNVTEYGAVGDGTGDQKEEIQAAVDAAVANGGGTVFVPPGTYQVKGTQSDGPLIDWGDGTAVNFVGAGWESEIKLAPNVTDSEEGAILISPGEGAELHSIAFNGNQQNNGGTGDGNSISDSWDGANIKVKSPNVTVHHTKSYNATGDGFESRSDEALVHNNLFIDNYEQDVHIWGSGSDVHDNICKRCKKDGSIRIYADSNTFGSNPPTDINIHDNVIIDPVTSGIELNANIIPRRVSIRGNVIASPGETGIYLINGIDVEVRDNIIDGAAQESIKVVKEQSANELTDITIADNRLQNGADTGILFDGANNSVIEGNRIKEHNLRGVHIRSQTRAMSEIEISQNNLVDNNLSDSGEPAIFVEGVSSNTISGVGIDGNTVNSTGSVLHREAVELNSSRGPVDTVRLRNNEARNTSAGPYANVASHSTVVYDNHPRVFLDVRQLASINGNRGFHDGSGANTEGPAFYKGTSSEWISLVDGTTIA